MPSMLPADIVNTGSAPTCLITKMTKKISDAQIGEPLPLDLVDLVHWLTTERQASTADLESLYNRFIAQRENRPAPDKWLHTLDIYFSCSASLVRFLRPSLADTSLPLHRKIRKKVKLEQKILLALAEEGMQMLTLIERHIDINLPQTQAKLLCNCMSALLQHLLLGYLSASPAMVGIWQKLHRVFNVADRLGLVDVIPQGVEKSVHSLYSSAVLLGCAQPASFTARTVNFIATWMDGFDNLVCMSEKKQTGDATFWIDPASDLPAIADSKRAASPETNVRYFSCELLVGRIKEELTQLEAGILAEDLGLPGFAATPVGMEAMRELIIRWSDPAKRRFQRRRISYHTELYIGLKNLLKFFQDNENDTGTSSIWVVINESPDGYAAMHVSGEVEDFSVGDIAAIKTEQGWQIGIVRWALSENQEHLELGLQVLAANAVSVLVIPSQTTGELSKIPALLLPAVKQLSSEKRLVVPAATLTSEPEQLILVSGQTHVTIREVAKNRLDERNARIEIFSITPL